jgi:hypothetical protein
MKQKISFIALTLLCMASISMAAIPYQINYEGFLKDSAGTPISGSLSATFNIYPALTGGAAIWTSVQTLTVDSGIYSANLSFTASDFSTVFDGSTRYLGIVIGTGSEMTPRLPIISVPYAYKSEVSDNASQVNSISASRTAAASSLYPLDASGRLDLTSSSGPFVIRAINDGDASSFAISAECTSPLANGIYGFSSQGTAILAKSTSGTGLHAISTGGGAILGEGLGSMGNGVQGIASAGGEGVMGQSSTSNGVRGFSSSGNGVYGNSTSGYGISGFSDQSYGIYGSSGFGAYGVCSARELGVLTGNLVLVNPSPPATSSSKGDVGTISWGTVGADTYLYICKSTNSWVRVRLDAAGW